MNRGTIIALVVCSFLPLAHAAPEPREGVKVGQPSAMRKLVPAEGLERLIAMETDIANLQPLDAGSDFPRAGEPFVPLLATVYVNPVEAARLAAVGLPAQPIDNPSVPDYPGGPTACSGWPSYATLVARMQTLASTYPGIIRLIDIGNSVNGRDLWVLKISDNPDLEEDEPEFRYSSTHHGTEGVGTEMTLRLAELLASSYGSVPTLTAMVDEMEFLMTGLSLSKTHERLDPTRLHCNRDAVVEEDIEAVLLDTVPGDRHAIGLRVDHAISTDLGVLVPYVRGEYEHEFGDAATNAGVFYESLNFAAQQNSGS